MKRILFLLIAPLSLLAQTTNEKHLKFHLMKVNILNEIQMRGLRITIRVMQKLESERFFSSAHAYQTQVHYGKANKTFSRDTLDPYQS